MSRKTFFLNLLFVGVLKVNDENSRIRIQIRIHYSEAWIRIRIHTKMSWLRNTGKSDPDRHPRRDLDFPFLFFSDTYVIRYW